ncbi:MULTISPECIES: hypothetical protein [unclassified Methylobacterium]|jgi:uncharacterized membrane protein YuzA (DUF378 family)|uniref:hypothetical protein n=1 Tax=unclassified Methylobacterium TaxID=2615210 RepID=UPI0013522EF4|nr:hypothetical protein [Methylobacterium sp. 2A]MWV21618.1 hypothetical protein [Methylobacterium sp. 2A]
MHLVHRILRLIESVLVAAVIGTVALVSRVIDATIGLVGRLSDRLDAKLAGLARESRERHRRDGRRQIDPISLK